MVILIQEFPFYVILILCSELKLHFSLCFIDNFSYWIYSNILKLFLLILYIETDQGVTFGLCSFAQPLWKLAERKYATGTEIASVNFEIFITSFLFSCNEFIWRQYKIDTIEMQLSVVDCEPQIHENNVYVEKWGYPCRSVIFNLFHLMAHTN